MRQTPTAFALGACGVFFLVRAWPTRLIAVDDAWISARYARNVAEGAGFVYNAGDPPVEGFTNLLWVLILAFGHWAGLAADPLMMNLGLFFGLLALPASWWLARELGAGPVAMAAPVLLALSPHVGVATTNGLETSLFLATVLCVLAASARSRGRWDVGLGLAVVLLAMIRPEGAAVGAVVVAIDTLRNRRVRWQIGGLWLAGLTGLFLWRWATFGHLVPNTFLAKSYRPWRDQIAFNADYLAPEAEFWIVVGLLVVVGGLVALRRPTLARVGAAATTLGLSAIALSVDLWMPGGRLLLAPLACGLCLACAAARGLPRLAVWAVAAVLCVPLVGGPLPAHVHGYARKHSASVPNSARHAAEHLRAFAAEGASLAIRDAGLFAYSVGSSVRVIELHTHPLTVRIEPPGKSDPRDYTPKDTAFFVATVRDPEAKRMPYPHDRKIWKWLGADYTYLGRVRQHHRRYYDIYVRPDLGVPPLDPTWVVNFAGQEAGGEP